MSEVSKPVTLDFREFSPREIGAKLRGLEGEVNVQLLAADDRRPVDAVGAGVAEGITVRAEGSVGDFAFFLSEKAGFDILGDAGDCCGHSMISGSILVHGSAGDSLGAFASGGFIAVHGQARRRCGHALAGADVFVRGAVGDQAGYGMAAGALVLGNGTGEELGFGMTGGVVFVRGEVKSVAKNVRAVRMKDADSMRLSLLLARAGIKGSGADFKAYRSQAGNH